MIDVLDVLLTVMLLWGAIGILFFMVDDIWWGKGHTLTKLLPGYRIPEEPHAETSADSEVAI